MRKFSENIPSIFLVTTSARALPVAIMTETIFLLLAAILFVTSLAYCWGHSHGDEPHTDQEQFFSEPARADIVDVTDMSYASGTGAAAGVDLTV